MDRVHYGCYGIAVPEELPWSTRSRGWHSQRGRVPKKAASVEETIRRAYERWMTVEVDDEDEKAASGTRAGRPTVYVNS